MKEDITDVAATTRPSFLKRWLMGEDQTLAAAAAEAAAEAAEAAEAATEARNSKNSTNTNMTIVSTDDSSSTPTPYNDEKEKLVQRLKKQLQNHSKLFALTRRELQLLLDLPTTTTASSSSSSSSSTRNKPSITPPPPQLYTQPVPPPINELPEMNPIFDAWEFTTTTTTSTTTTNSDGTTPVTGNNTKIGRAHV